MDPSKPENVFGVGAITRGERKETAVVVSGHVCSSVRDCPAVQHAGRYSPTSWASSPIGSAGTIGFARSRSSPIQPIERLPSTRSIFRPCVPEPWNIFQTYHNYDRPSRISGKSDPPKNERLPAGHLHGIALRARRLWRYRPSRAWRPAVRLRGGAPTDRRSAEPAYRVKAEKANDYIAGVHDCE